MYRTKAITIIIIIRLRTPTVAAKALVLPSWNTFFSNPLTTAITQIYSMYIHCLLANNNNNNNNNNNDDDDNDDDDSNNVDDSAPNVSDPPSVFASTSATVSASSSVDNTYAASTVLENYDGSDEHHDKDVIDHPDDNDDDYAKKYADIDFSEDMVETEKTKPKYVHKNLTEDRDRATGILSCVCINSIPRLTNLESEVVIVDEVTMCSLQNMFMNTRIMLHDPKIKANSKEVQTACSVDIAVLEQLLELIRNTQLLVIIDAAMKPSMVRIYHDLVHSTHETRKSTVSVEKILPGDGRKNKENIFNHALRNDTTPYRYTVSLYMRYIT